jgi:hypothetical protein
VPTRCRYTSGENSLARSAPLRSPKSKLTIHEEKIVKAAPPTGSRFKGYTCFVVQDLVVRPHVTNFRCERWQTPDGKLVTALASMGISVRNCVASCPPYTIKGR